MERASFFSDDYFMQQALKEAQIAFDEDEVPIGAVVVLNNKIIARGHNQTEKLNDDTVLVALSNAANPQSLAFIKNQPEMVFLLKRVQMTDFDSQILRD